MECHHKYNLITTIKKEVVKKSLFKEIKEIEEKAILICEKCQNEKIIGFK